MHSLVIILKGVISFTDYYNEVYEYVKSTLALISYDLSIETKIQVMRQN